MNEERRRLLETGAAWSAGILLAPPARTAAAGGAPAAGTPGSESGPLPTAAKLPPGDWQSVPDAPRTPSPGKPGEFDFLSGEWQILHWRRAAGAAEWDRFEGEATCWSILGGVASIEELRIPARNFSGMGLRLLDVGRSVWSDFWVNARSGELGTPGITGSFEAGKDLFYAEDRDDKGTYRVASLWDQITARSCRWRQAVSRDAGRSWDVNWVMSWQRR